MCWQALKCMSVGEKPGNELIHNKIFTLSPSTMVLWNASRGINHRISLRSCPKYRQGTSYPWPGRVIVLTPRVRRPKQGRNTPPIAESTSRSKGIDQTMANRFKHNMQVIGSDKLNKNDSKRVKTGQNETSLM